LEISSKGILGNLSHLRARLRGNSRIQKCADTEPPLRAELFSSEQMEQHGKTLADLHKLGLGHARDRLLTRLTDNEGVLLEVRNLLTEAVKAARRITPAGE